MSEPPSPGHDLQRNNDDRVGAGAATFGGWLMIILFIAMLLKACG